MTETPNCLVSFCTVAAVVDFFSFFILQMFVLTPFSVFGVFFTLGHPGPQSNMPGKWTGQD